MQSLNYRILAVVADPDAVTVLKDLCRKNDYSAEYVNSGKKGISLANKQHYDLIVAEVNLKGDVGGLDVLKEVRSHDLHLPVIILADSNDLTVSVQAINLGVSGYLLKPVDPDQISDTIKASIRQSKSRFLKNELTNYRMENSYQAVIKSSEQSVLKLIDTVDTLIDLVYPEEYGSFPDLKMAMFECLTNAVEHGNAKDPEKLIFFNISLKMDRILVHIQDQGQGFEANKVLKSLSGTSTQRGLKLIRHLMDEVAFNIQGNEINLLKILPEREAAVRF